MSTRAPGSPTCSPASPITRRDASTSCSPGTGAPPTPGRRPPDQPQLSCGPRRMLTARGDVVHVHEELTRLIGLPQAIQQAPRRVSAVVALVADEDAACHDRPPANRTTIGCEDYSATKPTTRTPYLGVGA